MIGLSISVLALVVMNLVLQSDIYKLRGRVRDLEDRLLPGPQGPPWKRDSHE